MTRIALAALALVVGTTVASAHDYGREQRIDAREAEQAGRITHARREGELTWLETFKLRKEQHRIRGMEAWAKRDGHVSREEARRIQNAQNDASRHIYRESNDGQKALWHRAW